MKPKDLEPDCRPMDLLVFKKKFNDWMDTVSDDQGMPYKVNIKMIRICLDEVWLKRLGKLEKYCNQQALWLEFYRKLLVLFLSIPGGWIT